MLIDAKVQARGSRDPGRQRRAAADAAAQAAQHHESASRQLARKQARATVRAVEIAKQASRARHHSASDTRKKWNDQIRSILATGRPVAPFLLERPCLSSDPTILGTVVEPLHEIVSTPIDSMSVLTDQAREPGSGTRPSRGVIHDSRFQSSHRVIHDPHSESSGRVIDVSRAQPTRNGVHGVRAQASPSDIRDVCAQASCGDIRDVCAQASRGDIRDVCTQASRGDIRDVCTQASGSDVRDVCAQASRGDIRDVRAQPIPGQLELRLLTPSSPADADRVNLAITALGSGALREKPLSPARFDEFRRPEPRDQMFLAKYTEPTDRLADLRPQILASAANAAADINASGLPVPQHGSRAIQRVVSQDAVNPKAGQTSLARDLMPEIAWVATSGNPASGERPAASQGRYRTWPQESVTQVRNKLDAEAQLASLAPPMATGIRMPESPKADTACTALLGYERMLDIFTPARGGMAGAQGERIDTEGMVRVMELLTRALERFTGTGEPPPIGAARPQTIAIPPALPGKPAPFTGRTDGSGESF